VKQVKIVMAGGSGLLGTALTEALVAQGHQVVILSRDPNKVQWQVPGSRFTQWSTGSSQAWIKEIDGADAVINLAGVSIAGESLLKMRWTPSRKNAILESRRKSGAALTEAVKRSKERPKVFIQSSAIGFYGTEVNKTFVEDDGAGNDYLSKVTQEWEASTQEIESLGVRRVIVRTGLVLSLRGGLLRTLMLPFQFGAGGRIGSGQQMMSWIAIQDWVKAVIHLLEDSKAKGVYNLTAPNPVANRQFAKELGSAMRRSYFLPTPALALKLALGQASTLALDGQAVLPRRLLDAGFRFDLPNLGQALKNLFQAPLEFRRSFLVKADIDAVAEYHRNTGVLRRLTPWPIRVQFQHVEPVREGSVANFTLWFGPIPVRWSARHYDVDPQVGFTDDLVAGPFVSWVHRHRFTAQANGTVQVFDDIQAELGRGGVSWLISRFMWATLPILFAFRAWRTRKDLEASLRGNVRSERGVQSV
jgi:uncharacterized protein (TIGR01777 family)